MSIGYSSSEILNSPKKRYMPMIGKLTRKGRIH